MDTDEYVFAEQVRLMYSQTKKLVIGGLLLGLILSAILWNVINNTYLLFWYSVIILITAVRTITYLAYLKNQNAPHLSLWNAIFLTTAFAYSLTMGSISMVFFLTNDAIYHFIVVAWLVGYSALAVSSYLMNYRAVQFVIAPTATLLIVSIGWVGTTLYLLAASALIIWYFIMYKSMKPVSQSMIKAISLNHQLGLEIEQRKILQNQLLELSIKDGLTGLFNRRHFDNTYVKELKRAGRSKEELSLIMMDIDSFKQFNDTYGHQAGDECLHRVSEAVQRCVKRPDDLVARYGGEEIVAFLPNTSSEHSFQLAEKMRIAVQDLAIPHKASIVANIDIVSLSVGVATLAPGVALENPLLLAKADEALYQAKASGRNQTVVST
ncbi:MAG: GGDEF domain-containing protein [Thiohalomonadales bacterium]